MSDDRAPTVNEIDRRWPTADAVAIDGATMQVVDRISVLPTFRRWRSLPASVDFHMGILLVWRISRRWWDLAARCALPSGWGTAAVDPPSAPGGLGSGAFAAAGVAVARLACPNPGAWAGVCPWIGHAVNGSQRLLLFIAVDYPAGARQRHEDDEVQRLSEDLRRADDHRYPAVFGAPGRRVVAGDRVFFAKAAGVTKLLRGHERLPPRHRPRCWLRLSDRASL